MAEAVTLAHVARPIAAMAALRDTPVESTFACDPRAREFVGAADVPWRPVASIDPRAFLDRLRRGTAVYDETTLRRYVDADLALIREIKPDLVIGDFRLSLSVSARVARVPYATIASACWSPAYDPPGWPVPELPMTRILPISVSTALFRGLRRASFAIHAQPLNRVRKSFGMPSLGADLRTTYTDADHVLYADLPELYPMRSLPPDHRFIGPALWEPPATQDVEWPTASDERPMVYLTLGSSGNAALLPTVIDALGSLPVTAMVATAGPSGVHAGGTPRNVRVTGMLPGMEAARRSRLVICNGGSLTCYQGLSSGVPVIGIASNLDQMLSIQAVAQSGAGIPLRADRLDPLRLRDTIMSALCDPKYASAARLAGTWCSRHRLAESLGAFISELRA